MAARATIDLNQNDFSYMYFWSTSHPDTSYQISSPCAFLFRRKSSKKIFKLATVAAILDFLLEWFYLFLIYKSSISFLARLESIGLSNQEKKRKTDFQDGCHGETILTIFNLLVTRMFPTKFWVNWPFWFRRRCEKLIFKMVAMWAILDFQSKWF